MGVRVPVVLGGVAITGIVAWFALRDGGSRPAPQGTPAPALTSGSRAPIAAPAGPTIAAPSGDPAVAPDGAAARPALPHTEPRPTAAEAFAAEPRDPAWAAATEREITRRFASLRGGKLARTECRQAQCLLVLRGSESELADTIAALEGPRGMHGFAKHVLLTAPTVQPDGSIVLHAYLQFAR